MSRANDLAYGRNFAEIYDLIQAHRDLPREADRLDEVLRQSVAAGASILDLGCGTGLHAIELGRRGYKVTGIDLAADMIAVAQRKNSGVTFICRDIGENSDLGPFDACVSLYNVVNCLEDMEALADFIRAVAAVLKPGAKFICECWNPIAVMREPPKRVHRTYETQLGVISRTALPSWDFMDQRLRIAYEIEIERPLSATSKFAATHDIRLFTPMEIKAALKKAGFHSIEVRTALPEFETAGADDRMLAIAGVKA